jgi:NDP-hexose C3-ketoreductase / dTDP-4-oxo-2-deoxy-alpha-D-pentos-2-ene 2,3-reductase
MVSNHTGLYTQLGRTGLKISRLVLGTVNFGGRVDEHQAHALLDHAVAAGINIVDTANIYGWRVHKGYTEEVLGRWFEADRSRRDDILLATKVGNPIGPGPNDRGLSARHIIAACEASLRRLRTDWIDLYQMHTVDRTVGWDEIWQAMELLVNQGKVRYVGSSNFAGWDIVMAQDAAVRRKMLGLASEQCVYNLVTRYPELEIMPAAHAYRIGVLVWSPLHGGLISGVLRKLAEGSAVKSAQGRAASALDSLRDVIAQYEEFCARLGRDPAEVGLAWVLSRPHVTAAVIGPRTPGHIDGAIRAMELTLSKAELAQLDELFPPVGRGGPGPEAWIS